MLRVSAFLAAGLCFAASVVLADPAGPGTGGSGANAQSWRRVIGIDSYTAIGDTDATLLTTDRYVVTGAALTAARTVTLPPALTVNPGATIEVSDAAATLTTTNTLTVAANTGDTITGGNIVLKTPGTAVRLRSDGASVWVPIVNGTGCDAGFTLSPAGCTWTQNPSAVSSVSWTGLTGSEYHLSCSNVVMSAAVNLFLQYGEGGTPTWETASYHYAIQGLKETNTSANAVSTSAAGISLNAALDATAAGLGVNFDIDIHGLQTASVNKSAHGNAAVPATGGVDATILSIAGVYMGDQNAISSVRLNVTSGTVTGGPCTLRKKV